MTASTSSGKLPGRYKGTRRRRQPPIVATCPCGRWRSKPLSPAKAEAAYQAHLAAMHGAGSSPAQTSKLQTSANGRLPGQKQASIPEPLSRDELMLRLSRPKAIEIAASETEFS